MKLKCFGLLIFVGTMALAQEAEEPSFEDQMSMIRGVQMFHAKAEFKCWSRDAIGYTCEVEDRGFLDCTQAAFMLKRRPCCKNMMLNGKMLSDGVASEFRMTYCSWLK